MATSSPDIVVIGSGIGGATLVSSLASTGAKILILESGDFLADRPENRDQKAIFQKGFFRPKEFWFEADGTPFNPGNYYNVGGNSKFYGAVMARYRREDFSEMQHQEGVSPAWPFSYEELEPWYCEAEKLYQVRGTSGEDPTEPAHSAEYSFGAVPDEQPMALLRARLKDRGFKPYSLPLAMDVDRWLSKGKTPWDAHPHRDDGKFDAETAALAPALKNPNVTLITNSRVIKLETDETGRQVTSVVYRTGNSEEKISARLVVLSAGAVQSAALLLRSANGSNPNGLANSSDQVGRNFMNHNASAVIGFSPSFRNDSIYQKTFGLNDFYLENGAGGPPLGNIQLLGRVSGTILKSNVPLMPEWLLNQICRHTIDFYAMSEDVPNPESRVRIDGDKIILQWQRTNWAAHLQLVEKLKSVLKSIGFPVVLSKPFDKRTPSHQCGTVRMGNDPKHAPLDMFCRAYDHDNLFVVDASFLPTSAAVNPSLTIAAQALRVANHIRTRELRL